MSVDDIGSLAAAAAIFEDGPAEERKSKLVVAKISSGVTVDPATVEKGRVLDEDDAQTRSEFSLVVTGAAVGRVDRNMNRADTLHAHISRYNQKFTLSVRWVKKLLKFV